MICKADAFAFSELGQRSPVVDGGEDWQTGDRFFQCGRDRFALFRR